VPGAPADGAVDPEVAVTARLLHRRRGWAWTAGLGFLALLVASSVYSNRYSVTGSGPLAVLVLVMLFGVLTVAGLVVAVTDSVLLGRRPAALRKRAADYAAHHPVHAHAYRYPPRHVGAWVAGWIVMLGILGLGVLFLPGVVNGVAYLAGGNSATFVPESYAQSYGYHGGDTPVTEGILQTGSGSVSATWPNVVPLGQPFRVREPVWTWGLGSALIDGDGTAVIALVCSLLFVGAAVFVLFFMYRLVRNWLRHRRRAAALSAVAEVGGRGRLVRDAVEHRGAPLASG
jgi:hypothetical protein